MKAWDLTAPLAAIAPWISVALAFASVVLVSNSLVRESGTLFSLPAAGPRDMADVSAAALAMPSERGTLVFFDDTRFMLEDPSQAAKLESQIGERLENAAAKTLLVLADRRVPGGDLMRLSEIAGRGGASKILFAGRDGDGPEGGAK